MRVWYLSMITFRFLVTFLIQTPNKLCQTLWAEKEEIKVRQLDRKTKKKKKLTKNDGTWSGSSCWDVGCITDTTLSSDQKCKVRGIWWGERVCVYLCSDAPACVYQRLSDWVQQQLWQTSRAQLHWYTTHMKACTHDLVSPVATANPGDALLKHSIGVCIVCIHLLSFFKKETLLRIFF